MKKIAGLLSVCLLSVLFICGSFLSQPVYAEEGSQMEQSGGVSFYEGSKNDSPSPSPSASPFIKEGVQSKKAGISNKFPQLGAVLSYSLLITGLIVLLIVIIYLVRRKILAGKPE
ncbi:hypothetical protein [Carnobacterium maltaromaticum]|uniref:hypothetical protein n=1 Tax=Carnobacterium maltaromaticum TaxID=2751 RepID=UPI00295F003E|nr:hypothetical protein [Carnobacterium maltaromaticum]